MTDREKVIKGLECCSAMSGNACRKCPYGNECLDTDLPYGEAHLSADALELLKEQEAKKPIYNYKKYGDCLPHCPSCEKVLPNVSQYGFAKFCPECGRVVKWEWSTERRKGDSMTDDAQIILRYLENAYSGARASDDIDSMTRISRAIAAFKLPTDKDCIIEEAE